MLRILIFQIYYFEILTCLDVAKEARDLEREAPRDTGRFFVITSKASPNLQSGAWREEGASRGSLASSMKKLVVFSR